jgi:peroxiredoxin family protein
MTAPARESWVVLLHRDEAGGLYEAAAMTAAASSLDVSVTLVWFDAALAALVSGKLEDSEDGAGAAELLAGARETGRVRFLACSASAVRSEEGIGAVRDRVDDIVGWPTVVGLIRAASKAFVW